MTTPATIVRDILTAAVEDVGIDISTLEVEQIADRMTELLDLAGVEVVMPRSRPRPRIWW